MAKYYSLSNIDNSESSKIILAKWKDRFFAWLVDFVIISLRFLLSMSCFAIENLTPFSKLVGIITSAKYPAI